MALSARSEIAPEHTWNAPSVYADQGAWEADFAAVHEALPRLSQYQGRLSESPETLAAWFDEAEGLIRRTQKLYFYARMSQAVETTNADAIAMTGKAAGLYSRVMAAAAFAEPELIAAGAERVTGWAQTHDGLKRYQHYFDNLFRTAQHIRSAEVEEVLALAGDPFSAIDNTEEMLTSADMTFAPVRTATGESVELGQGNLDTFLSGADREARRVAWENYADSYLGLKNTLTSNYLASVKRDVFYARARRYESSLAASLFENNIPEAVFHSLLETHRKHLPTWHKYWRVRRQALGVDTLHPYDIWAPISKAKPNIPYTQAVDWISAGMAPLGTDYVNVLRRGTLEERWVDIYPNRGKTAGAFSFGTYDTYPFIMMSYDDSISGLSTLAHELGHSMHSYYSRLKQPYIYANYSLFVAEVASNFNQAMTRAHLFATNDDPQFQIAVIEEAMDNFHRYFFIMPTLARFELEMHQRVERGGGFTPDDAINLMADLFEEGYGGEMHIDRERVGITWAQFGHLYSAYYVYQYATGISAANALARTILSGDEKAAHDYLGFLGTGGARYPVDALKLAGVDMTTPDPVEMAFGVLADYVDRLEQLTR